MARKVTEKAPVSPVITDKSITMQAGTYSITNITREKKDNSIYVFTMCDGFGTRVHIAKDSPLYDVACKAYYAYQSAQKAPVAPVEKAPVTPVKSVKKAPVAPVEKAPVAPVKSVKKAPVAPVEKAPAYVQDDAGIHGKGWDIVYDTGRGKVRVVLPDDAPDAIKNAVIDAKFYYSRETNSYHKGLHDRAKKAALALAETLSNM